MFFVSTWALLYVGWVSASSRSRLRSLACELLRIWKEGKAADSFSLLLGGLGLFNSGAHWGPGLGASGGIGEMSSPVM